MRFFVFFVFFFSWQVFIAQETYTPTKIKENEVTLDGLLSEKIWKDATKIPLDIEFSPANNLQANKKTTAYISYSDTFLFIAVHAEDDPNNIRASIRPRDDFNIWNDDLILVRLDPFADARNNLGLAVNALGSQFDVKQVNALSDEDRYDSTFNMNFESKAAIIDNGYTVEMKIPFSEIPFPNGTDQEWHINFYRRYFENGNEIEVSSQPRDRNNNCVVCQTTDNLILQDIVIDKRLEILPYISSNIQGSRNSPDEKISYGSVKGKVGLVSGGGSGHEPSHAGYVGVGMLDGAVSGEVFTSPTPDQVFEAIKAVDSGSGVLLIIKNYTGDVMNFEMAAELAEAEGINVAKVVVNDDVAVENSTYTTGRRGIAGTVLVHKIAGAAAERGATLEEVEAIANKVIDNVRSMGMALTPCTIPAVGKPGFSLGENEIEIGMGIHGEPGIEKTSIQTANTIAETLLTKVLDDLNIKQNDKVAVLINGLGATPLMELYILNKKVASILDEQHVEIYDTFVGEFMTALEMAGCSISVLKLDQELMELLDSHANTLAFKR